MNSQPSARAFGYARIVLTDPRVDRERRANAQALEQLEEAPHADPHAVFVPAPIRYIGYQRLAGRRREHLACHRLADVPDFQIDDGPEDKPRIALELEWGPVDNGGVVAPLARQHGVQHRVTFVPGKRPPVRSFAARSIPRIEKLLRDHIRVRRLRLLATGTRWNHPLGY